MVVYWDLIAASVSGSWVKFQVTEKISQGFGGPVKVRLRWFHAFKIWMEESFLGNMAGNFPTVVLRLARVKVERTILGPSTLFEAVLLAACCCVPTARWLLSFCLL